MTRGLVWLLVGAFEVRGQSVDALVEARLRARGMRPLPPCTDEVFLRRAFLDVTGRLPDADRAVAFLDDRAADKRARLVDELLASPGRSSLATLRWCDVLRVKSEFPINLWPRAVEAYHAWVWEAMRDNRPYDRFVRELLTSSGSSVRDPPVNFYRALDGRGPDRIARAVALTWLGSRLDRWPAERRDGLVRCFSRVAYKTTSEWKEEIVLVDPRPAGPLDVVWPDGTRATLPATTDPRVAFYDWLTGPGRMRLAEAVVNRVWAWSMGRGLVHEVDDLREDNLPAHPDVLVFLARELIDHGYDLCHIQRSILTSQTYQRSAGPGGGRPEEIFLGARAQVARLDAEVLIDAINDLTGDSESYSSAIPEPYTFVPSHERTVDLADGSLSSPFLELFGRPARDTGLAGERSNRMTHEQLLHWMNSSHLIRKVAKSDRIATWVKTWGRSPDELVTRIYLSVLCRRPTAGELREASAPLRRIWLNRRPAVDDLVWALLNSKEFLYRH